MGTLNSQYSGSGPCVRGFIYSLVLLSDGENLQETNCPQRTESWRGGLEWDIVTSSLLASLLLPGCHEVSRPLVLRTPFMMPLQSQKQWANRLQTETPNWAKTDLSFHEADCLRCFVTVAEC